jgi:hypothetical protein
MQASIVAADVTAMTGLFMISATRVSRDDLPWSATLRV